MKKISYFVSGIVASIILTTNLLAADVEVSFADEKWNGNYIPQDEVCSDYNIEPGSTPGLYIDNLPANAKKVILKFNDKTFTKMDNGGHGILSYEIQDGSVSVEIPPQIGETFELEEGFEVVKAHTGTRFNKKPGAYLAPCSGGKGNTYTVNIDLVDENGKVLFSKELTLGKY